MTEPRRLIGRGRSADIYDIGEGRVLRRSRSGPISTAEPVVMTAVAAAGYPVPRVHAVDGCDMIMDRVDGVDLLTRLSRKPWQARSVGRLLAELHRRLADIPLGDTDLPVRIGERESFVHGDLHPGNVLMAGAGPVVIDWEGAGVGARDADIATTWLLLETADPDAVPMVVRPVLGRVRRTILRSFLEAVPKPRVETIAGVCEVRLGDKNMRDGELERIRHFAERHAR